MPEDLEVKIKVSPDTQSLKDTEKRLNETFQDMTVDFDVDSAKVEQAARKVSNTFKKYLKTSGTVGEGGIEGMFPGISALSTKNQAKLKALLENAPGKAAFMSRIPDPTGMFQPTQVNRSGGMIYHSNLVGMLATDAAAKMGIKGTGQKDIFTASLLHGRFKYLDSGRANPNAISDAAIWARSMGLGGAADILSGKNQTGYDILSKADYVASMRSRADDLVFGDKGSPVWSDVGSVFENAVAAGEGRWKDAGAEHTADNFEMISDNAEDVKDAIDEIGEASGDETDSLQDWRDNLKGVIGDLSMIGEILGKMGATALGITVASAHGAATASVSLNNLAPFADLSTTDLLYNKLAAKKIGIGEEDVNNAVVQFAQSRGQFVTTGEGFDLFSMTFQKAIQEAVTSQDPNESYWKLVQEALNDLKGADKDRRQQLLALIPKYLGETGAQLVGYAYAKNITDVNDLRSSSYDRGKYATQYNQLESQNEDLVEILSEIKDTTSWWKRAWNEWLGMPFLKQIAKWAESLTDAAQNTEAKVKEKQRQLHESVISGAYFEKSWLQRADESAWMSNLGMSLERDVIDKAKEIYGKSGLRNDIKLRNQMTSASSDWYKYEKYGSTTTYLQQYAKGKMKNRAGDWYTTYISKSRDFGGVYMSEYAASKEATDAMKAVQSILAPYSAILSDKVDTDIEGSIRQYVGTYFAQAYNMTEEQQRAYFTGEQFNKFIDLLSQIAPNMTYAQAVQQAEIALNVTVSPDNTKYVQVQNKHGSANTPNEDTRRTY